MDKKLIERIALEVACDIYGVSGKVDFEEMFPDKQEQKFLHAFISRIDAERGNGATAKELIRTAPARIWLQVSEDEEDYDKPFPLNTEDVSWCESHVLVCEVEYVRADRSQTIPEGWALVPVEPTEEILDAMENTARAMPDDEDLVIQYTAMLAVAQGEQK